MRRKIIIAVLIVPVLAVVAALIYVTTADLSGYRDRVAEILTEQLGRELVIAGEFQPDISISPRLVATDIRLKNADWGAEPAMVQIDRLEAGVDLWSLISGPIQVTELTIDGARIVLEDPGDGRAPNWEFGESSDEPTDALMFDGIEVVNVVLEYRDAVLERPLVLEIDRLEARSEEDGRLDLRLDGRLNDAPLDASGLLGPMNHLIDMVDVREDIRVRLGETELSLEGAVADLATLEGLDLRLDVHGTDIDHLTRVLGLPSLGSGPFGVEGSMTPSARGVEVNLEASLGELSADVEGFVSALLDPVELDVAVAAACPDLGAIASLLEIDGVPAEAFEIDGRVRRHDERFTFEELEIKLGKVAVAADGVLGELPSLVDTDFTFTASGPALSAFSELAGVELPAEPFRVDARLLAQAEGISVESFAAEVGSNTLRIGGIVGEPPDLYGTALEIRAAGPGLSSFEGLAGIELPDLSWELSGPVSVTEAGYELEGIEARVGDTLMRVGGRVGPPPDLNGTDVRVRVAGSDLSALSATAGTDLPAQRFSVEGRVRTAGEGFALEGVVANLGGIVIEAGGRLGAPPDLDGSDVKVSIRGSDLSEVARMAGVEQELPAEAYDVRGRVRIQGNGYALEGVEAKVADIVLKVDGRVGPPPELTGTELRVRLGGTDLSRAGALAGVDDLPVTTYGVEGRVRVVDGGYALDGVVATVGPDIEIEAEGLVGQPPELHGTEIGFRIRGSDLSALEAFGEIPSLPAEPFTVSGRVGLEGELYRLKNVVAELVGNRVGVDGTAGPMPELTSTDLGFDISIPDLDALGRMMTEAGVAEVPALPAMPFSSAGRLEIREEGYELQAVEARYGAATFKLHGTVGNPPELRGTDLTIDAAGPDGSAVGALAGLDLPAEPFRVRGRVGRRDAWARFDDLVVDLGEYHVEVDGAVGEPPEMIGTDIEILARGPSLELVSAIADLPDLPVEPFEVSGHFEGNPERFKMTELVARLGDSDLSGSFRVDLGDKPDVTGKFSSEKVDLSMFVDFDEEPTEPDAPPSKGKQMLIPDEPLDLEVLHSANADVTWKGQNVITPAAVYSDFEIGVRLEDGKLLVDPFVGKGQWGGEVRGSVALETVDGVHHVEAHFTGDEWKLALPGSEVRPEDMPGTSLELHIEGRGRTLHEIASSLDGGIGVARGAGLTDNDALDLLGADVLSELFDVLNPFAKQQEYTQLECTIVFIELEDGVAKFDPMAIRTDKMTLLGKGKIDFTTEKIRLDWKTKPRKGIGIGAGTLVNPFVELGGTLSKPHINLDAVDAATTTGMAVATVGLSILGEGMWNRFSAGKKVCAKVLADAKERLELTRPHTDGD